MRRPNRQPYCLAGVISACRGGPLCPLLGRQSGRPLLQNHRGKALPAVEYGIGEECVRMRMQGKVAIVTGAGYPTGLGRAIALALAGEGADVVAADIHLEGAEAIAREIREGAPIPTAASIAALPRRASSGSPNTSRASAPSTVSPPTWWPRASSTPTSPGLSKPPSTGPSGWGPSGLRFPLADWAPLRTWRRPSCF